MTMFVAIGELASALPYARGSAVIGLKPPRSASTVLGTAGRAADTAGRVADTEQEQ